MMPPPRRFSAAPLLNCPHRQHKSSSTHSSSSLHRTYSIDSSESMITVIPANLSARLGSSGSAGTAASSSTIGQPHQQSGNDLKRLSRGSSGILSGLDTTNSFTQASPLSPRSPSRCLSPTFATCSVVPQASDLPKLPGMQEANSNQQVDASSSSNQNIVKTDSGVQKMKRK